MRKNLQTIDTRVRHGNTFMYFPQTPRLPPKSSYANDNRIYHSPFPSQQPNPSHNHNHNHSHTHPRTYCISPGQHSALKGSTGLLSGLPTGLNKGVMNWAGEVTNQHPSPQTKPAASTSQPQPPHQPSHPTSTYPQAPASQPHTPHSPSPNRPATADSCSHRAALQTATRTKSPRRLPYGCNMRWR